MSEVTSSNSNSTLYFMVGGILVAVLAIGYFTLGRNIGDAGSTPSVAAKGSDAEAGSSFKLEVEKDGSVSGSIDQKSKE
jgi:hypothetical protein